MERVNHVHVAKVGGGGFVGHVDGVLQRQVPYRESLKLGIASLDATLVFVVQLAQADGHLAASRPWSRDDHQGACGFHIVVAAKAFLRVNEGDVVRIALNDAVVIHLNAHALKALAVSIGAGLTVVVRDHNRIHHETTAHKLIAEAQHIHIVSDAQVAAYLVFLNVDRADDDDNFRNINQLRQHSQFAVGLETGQHTAGVEVVEEFSAKFEIQFVAEFRDAILDVFRLDFKVFFVVESVFCNSGS